jgi:Uma2 family endonuclease
MPLYAKTGVQYIWLLDPLAKTLEVYQLEKQYWKLIGTFSGNDKVSILPFQEISIDLSFLWEE